MSKRASARVSSKRSARVVPKRSARVVSKHAFARVDLNLGLVAHSPEVLGMATCLDSVSHHTRPFGAYCFKLSFTPVSVVVSPIAHPNDDEFTPILYTAANVTGPFTKDNQGHGVECRAGFQHAAVVGRRAAADGIGVGSGGFFVMFFG